MLGCKCRVTSSERLESRGEREVQDVHSAWGQPPPEAGPWKPGVPAPIARGSPTGDIAGSRENSYRLKLWGRGRHTTKSDENPPP